MCLSVDPALDATTDLGHIRCLLPKVHGIQKYNLVINRLMNLLNNQTKMEMSYFKE